MLYQLEALRSQDAAVIRAVLPTIRRSSYYSHSESILQAMLCSDDKEERKEAVDKILTLRGSVDDEAQIGDRSPRPRRNPLINLQAETLSELIDWTDITEPPLTCTLTNKTLKGFAEVPMEVPKWPSHTQSVERCVKMVTEAAAHVYSQERREGYIRGQVTSRGLMSSNGSKKDLINLTKLKI